MQRKLKPVVLAALLVFALLLFTACGQSTTSPAPGDADSKAETVEITDAGGRKVTIPAPDKLERVYPTGTNSLVALYTIAPDKMTAAPNTTPNPFSEGQKKFLHPSVHDLPNYGTQSGNGTLNLEAIKAGNVQVLLGGTVGKVTQNDISSADELQAQLQIPVVLISGEMDDFAETYEFLGRMLGREEEAKKLTVYCQDIVEKVIAVSAQIPLEERTTLYYAEGADGLATEPPNSSRSVVFNTAGARNIAEVDALPGFGQTAVSMEQVLHWNPEVIIVQGGSDAYHKIKTDPNWSKIDAVKNGHVYKMPDTPFSWADRPPSVNRFIGLHWIAHLLYPDLYDIDMIETARDYYKVMYHVDISRADMEELLKDSLSS